MTKFEPELSLSASESASERTYRFAFYLGNGENYIVHCKNPTLRLAPDASLGVAVVEDEHAGVFVVTVGGTDADDARVELAHLEVAGTVPERLRSDLLDAVQRVLFRAVAALVVAPAPVQMPAPLPAAFAPAVHAVGAGASAASASWPRPKRAFLVLGLSIAIGVGLVCYGAYETYSRGHAAQGDATDPANFAEMQAKIRKQIGEAAQSGTPAVMNAEKMDNISLATMRAMGLDPGKANAGCLVAVKK